VSRGKVEIQKQDSHFSTAQNRLRRKEKNCRLHKSLDTPYLCLNQPQYLVGLSFCYRAINPGSGVSPIVPIMLLLFSWYLWAVYQTRRLRFSAHGRPRLPRELPNDEGNRYFVSDDSLGRCKRPRDYGLYKNITCLLITREVVRRFQRARNGSSRVSDWVLAIVYAVLLIWFAFLTPVSSLEHFLWHTGKYWSNPYEFLIGGLFFPLLAVCLTGWLRLIFIWGALRRGMLEHLENLPIRFAFNRLKKMGWITMLRQSGLHEQWRDMARSLESMRQMLNQPDFACQPLARREFEGRNSKLLQDIAQLRRRRHSPKSYSSVQPQEHDYHLMGGIERQFAEFSEVLLSAVLIPYWTNKRTGLVESEEEPDSVGKELQNRSAPAEPVPVLAAEEFLAIRYLALIRAVLANMRCLMIFVSASFVLAILAWNSYPFQPRQQVDWLFTGLLVVLGAGVIWVLAQMHRDPILSRITDTRPNALGWDFYLRVISFGALPVLAWLAYQFPDLGSAISKFIQPAVVK
jgi:hypothetical protein